MLRYYPHMLFEDVEVWTRFLTGDHPRIYELWYDVHVGKPVEPPAGSPAFLLLVAAGVSRKRIDVVCRVDGGYWVVEVKPFGNMVALGQALGYWGLFKSEFQVSGLVKAVVVCDTVDPDLELRFSDFGILVFETGFSFAI